MDNEFEMCCGNTCDKGIVAKQLKAQGASEFLDFVEINVKEDMSTAALTELLELYVETL